MGLFRVRCEACAYRSAWPTRSQAVSDALGHRSANPGHLAKVWNVLFERDDVLTVLGLVLALLIFLAYFAVYLLPLFDSN